MRPAVKLALLVLLALIAVACAGMAEALVRWRERNRAIPGTMSTMLYAHNRLGYALVRNSDYFGWVHIDSLGLRGRDVALAKPEGTLRILADGGSTTFDPYVTSDDSTWPAHLQRILNGRGVGSVQVLNAGVPGYKVFENVSRFQLELYRLKPDVIVLLQGHNDLNAFLVNRFIPETNTPGEVPPASRVERWLGRHSLLYSKAIKAWQVRRIRTARSPSEGGLSFDSASSAAIARFRRDLTAYVLVTQQSGARTVLVVPVRVSDTLAPDSYRNAYGGAPLKIVREGYRRIGEVIREVASATGADVIETEGVGLDRVEFYEAGDPVHLLNPGSRLLAERIADQLVGLGVVPTRP